MLSLYDLIAKFLSSLSYCIILTINPYLDLTSIYTPSDYVYYVNCVFDTICFIVNFFYRTFKGVNLITLPYSLSFSNYITNFPCLYKVLLLLCCTSFKWYCIVFIIFGRFVFYYFSDYIISNNVKYDFGLNIINIHLYFKILVIFICVLYLIKPLYYICRLRFATLISTILSDTMSVIKYFILNMSPLNVLNVVLYFTCVVFFDCVFYVASLLM